ncbi:MAG TPA: hypothetical protein VFJ82_05500 [Longimicrobium sp.]|nr:hypothetical protein [Longimicrobium sp.]
MLAELDPEHAVMLFDVLRAASLWAADDGAAGWYDPKLLRRWEKAILTGHLDEHLRSAAGVLIGELVHPETSDPRQLSMCCLQISEWALGRGAVETSIEFNRLAALVWPTNARLAYVTGRRYGSVCRFKDSDIWLRRAARIARWYADWEAFADALTSIGMLAYRQGNIPRARSFLDRALRVARRRGLRQLEGEILHDRFTVAFTSNEKTDAEALARAAYQRYLPSHERLPALAYDIAYYWLTRGYAARALPVLRLLRAHFPQPAAQFQVLCASARAAGALHDRTAFRAIWAEANDLMYVAQSSPVFGIALIDLGYGAAHLGDWVHAEAAFLRAAKAAPGKDQGEDRLLAEAALEAVRRRENPDPLPLRRVEAETTELGRALVLHLSGSGSAGNAAGRDVRPPQGPGGGQ